ncbi:MAG: discoidin domain-containing protein [Myxococcaceae bacterium]
MVSTLTNFALRSRGASVRSVSSNWGGGDNDSTFGANKAIDGDFVTEWSTNGDGDAARVELDLGQVRHITAFGFRSRSMTDGTAIIRKVGLTLDGATELVFETPDPTQLYVFDLPAPVDARLAVVHALVTTSGNTGAKEIQLLSP